MVSAAPVVSGFTVLYKVVFPEGKTSTSVSVFPKNRLTGLLVWIVIKGRMNEAAADNKMNILFLEYRVSLLSRVYTR